MPVTGNNNILHNLSIRITADGFSFFVTEAASGDTIQCEDREAKGAAALSEALAKVFASPTFTPYEFQSVRVVMDCNSTCIPAALAVQEEEVQQIYRQVFSASDIIDCNLHTTPLASLGVVVAFTVPVAVEAAIRTCYPEAIFQSSHADIMQGVAAFCQRRPVERQPLFAYLQDKQLHVFSISEDRLLFANRFELGDNENSFFFLLSVWKELKLDVRENVCFIAGDSAYTPQLANEVRKFLLHVEEMDADVLFRKI